MSLRLWRFLAEGGRTRTAANGQKQPLGADRKAGAIQKLLID